MLYTDGKYYVQYSNLFDSRESAYLYKKSQVEEFDNSLFILPVSLNTTKLYLNMPLTQNSANDLVNSKILGTQYTHFVYTNNNVFNVGVEVDNKVAFLTEMQNKFGFTSNQFVVI